MTEAINQTKVNSGAEKADKKKKWQNNALILAAVLILSAVLPPRYKALSPLLFLLSPLLDALNKLRTDSIQPGHATQDKHYSSYKPELASSSEPYSYKSKNPKDPRKYKPIG